LDDKGLRELIDLIEKSNFATFELEREGFRLKVVKNEPLPAAPKVAPRLETTPAPAATVPEAAAATAADLAAGNGLVDVASPIVGTFYESPSPDAAPFVRVGTAVKKGQVLCIVEAMKLMNEIESEIDAEVVEILASNGQPVEFGEILFKLRPA
jgi:acetyl-CoA carboxylase biotin carboxyl carrier protein